MVVVAAACRPAAEDDVADASDDDGGGESVGDDDDATTSDPLDDVDVPAFEPCWRWDPTGTWIGNIRATTDGDLLVAGRNQATVTRLSADGEARWTIRPQNVNISDLVALPDGGFAIVGQWAGQPLAFARAYDAEGDLAWEAAATSGSSYTAGWWWAERELLVLTTRSGVPVLDAFDASGALVESFTPPSAGWMNQPVRLNSITPLGSGFLVVGGQDGDHMGSLLAAYDDDATLRWQLGSYDDGDYYLEAASWSGEWAILAGAGAEISRIDEEGQRSWTWPGDDDSEPAIAVAPDGRTYVAMTNIGAPAVLLALSPEGELEALVELEDDDAFGNAIAWSQGRVYVLVSDVPGHVECWEPPA